MHILTLDDLAKFCEQNNFVKFDAKDSGYQICVQIPAQFSQENSDDSMLFANVLAFHTGVNRNKSSLTEDAAKKAIKNLAYKPVLANFCEIDGVRDFTSHDFDVDENGNYIYYEKQVGCFTADKAYMKQDPDHDDRMNVFAKVAIPREYTDAAEIIERKNGTKCSIELCVNSLSYSAKDKMLYLEDVDVMGLTLLGVNPDTGEEVQEGMQGAHVQIEDFSVENNSLTFNSTIINEIAEAVANRLDNQNQRKEEEPVDKDFEEKIEEEVTNVMDATDEENQAVVTEASECVEETVVEETPEEVVEEFDEVEDKEDTEEVVTDDTFSDKKKYSVNGMEFEVSLSDIQNAVYELVNNTYAESDNDYYMVEVYEGSKSVVMSGLWSGKSYKQSYKVRGGVYSLVGDRVPVKAVYVTADEEAELDKMRSSYAEIKDKLAKYESEPAKMEILNSDEYAKIADTVEFAYLKKEENHFDLSVEEVREKADSLLLAYAKTGKLDFAVNDKKVGMKKFGNKASNKNGRYGKLFKN